MAVELTSIEVRQGGRLVGGVNVEPEKFLEHCARVVARASGYEFTGPDMLRAAKDNPRAAEFVSVAREVLKEVGLDCRKAAKVVCRK